MLCAERAHRALCCMLRRHPTSVRITVLSTVMSISSNIVVCRIGAGMMCMLCAMPHCVASQGVLWGHLAMQCAITK
mgnify:CR=1 FL=1